ncbi:MAG: hypothetical protein Q9223_000856 [Gallowayella weberi]
MSQTPMISCPLKQTNEIDWVYPLKTHIRQAYGDDPERYAEECNTLNRLRQDMRGAGKDSAAGRDLLYRYYGQLELLDLRFPVDENHIKISFTWLDAFTHKPISQYSLAYEKASIIFNISAVLSCHAAAQNRFEDSGLKTAYHSFQAAAGMFTYINENFLHAPSTDLSRDTVKTLIAIMLAQGQEVFLQKQIADDKKVGLLAKLASQASYLYSQALEGIQENVQRGVFDKLWVQVAQVKYYQTSALAQYYQALADDDTNAHGVAIARLQVAEADGREAVRTAAAFPSSVSPNSNLGSDTGANLTDACRKHLATVQERLAALNKDNDFIYHQTIPVETTLSVIPKLPAAKAIPVSELYQGQDIQRIIGPDIFQKLVPMSVTESASLYDEEKAKLIRAEAENVETANGEMAASLDYLKLPESLNILKGGTDQGPSVDEDFRTWCEELAGHEPSGTAFEQLSADKTHVTSTLDRCSKQLDMEESICEKMRSKYGADWTQQPSSRLTSTLWSDIQSYRGAIDEASNSDTQLLNTARQHKSDFDEMRSAGETDEADVLYQRAMQKAGATRSRARNGITSPASTQEGSLLDEDYDEGGTTVPDQIVKVEDLLKRLNLIKRDRMQVLKDLKEKAQSDDISSVLILNKKSIPNHESQLFQAELEKYRPHQNRLLQGTHKQAALMKELTKTYGDLLQDKRVRSEQMRYENFTRQRSQVVTKYKRIFQAFNGLVDGLMRAQSFYTEMKDTVESLEKNVETFVNNRRSEGAQLLGQIEREKASASGGQADRERDRLRELMERISMDPSSSPTKSPTPRPPPLSRPLQTNDPYLHKSPPPSSNYHPKPSSTPSIPPSVHSPAGLPRNYSQQPVPPNYGERVGETVHAGSQPSINDPYNPMVYPFQSPMSPPPAGQGMYHPNHAPPPHQAYPQQAFPQSGQYPHQGYIPPPPPPGPPPPSQMAFGNPDVSHLSGPVGYAHYQPPRQNGGSAAPREPHDPWAGLNAWK